MAIPCRYVDPIVALIFSLIIIKSWIGICWEQVRGRGNGLRGSTLHVACWVSDTKAARGGGVALALAHTFNVNWQSACPCTHRRPSHRAGFTSLYHPHPHNTPHRARRWWG